METGLARYKTWQLKRNQSIEAARMPRFRVVRATEAGLVGEADFINVEAVRIGVDISLESRGRRFGKLVHAVLQAGGNAAAYGRRFNATPEEIEDAAKIGAALAVHPLIAPAPGRTVYRELPVVSKLADGTVIEGRIDLAWTDGTSWTVIDYKTDSEARETYKRQLQLYALALQRATGKPIRAILVEAGYSRTRTASSPVPEPF
jgi:hypothetical protein